jgi:hypothetical protein
MGTEASPCEAGQPRSGRAQALERLHADDPDSASAQLAQQYAGGGQGKKAVHYYQ